MTDDTTLAQLLISRLCHDLVGPAGAVNAGLELADEGGLDEATLDLMTTSAGEMTRRLSYFRIVFGAATGKLSPDGTFNATEIRALALSLINPSKIILDWPEDAHAPNAFPAEQGKMLLLLILLGSESLPRGGQLSVHAAKLPEGLGLAVSASGEGARLRDDVVDALGASSVHNLTPRNVHGYFTQLLARQLHGQVDLVRENENEIRLTALFPSA